MSGTEQDRGIIPRAILAIFEKITARADKNEYLLRASYLEVYNESTYDLLTDDKRVQKLREDKGEFIFLPGGCRVAAPLEV